ncbi:hypothetical protein V22_12640 [Calycomorphotria hydatis]|uniref:Uncharacterized protein n=1 Tax=Calycomorphotria hydatis TaxID=2528027 RepID=A0A517T6N3_9PLAN|nr:hypothetical protein V22_12640 [Calycomorphotria hydatis]
MRSMFWSLRLWNSPLPVIDNFQRAQLSQSLLKLNFFRTPATLGLGRRLCQNRLFSEQFHLIMNTCNFRVANELRWIRANDRRRSLCWKTMFLTVVVSL